jgi:hypothetical protein
LALAAMALVGIASRVGWGETAVGHSELRLSWRVRSEPDRVCRRRTPEELARLPVHMREEEICEQRMLPYHLRVTVGDSVLDDRPVLAAGARSDRPLYVFGRFPITPGRHVVRVSFVREGATTPSRAHADVPPTHAPPPVAPLALALDTVLTFAAGDVLVVSYDEARGRLQAVGRSEP